MVGIEEKWWSKPAKKYSGGMRQRLGFAAAFLNPHNNLLILDEPTSNLDPFGRREILNLIKQLNTDNGTNVFISSHVLSEVEQICEYVFIINKGRIVNHGKISELSKLFSQNQYKINCSDNKLFLSELQKAMKLVTHSFTAQEE